MFSLVEQTASADLGFVCPCLHEGRTSRQTDLHREFQLHVVCSWLGNSPRFAQQSYLPVIEDDFARAAEAKNVMEG